MIVFLVLCFALIGNNMMAGLNPQSTQQANGISSPRTSKDSASRPGQESNPQSIPGSNKTFSQRNKHGSQPKQTKRILWMVPNFAAVSAGEKFSPLSAKGKFRLASEDSFDYSSFVWTGVLAAQDTALKAYPEFGHGAAAYGRYYWHGFVDGVSGTYFTEAIVPAITHEDPRYFTLGHGGFWRRLGYALSRTVVTRTDSGGESFNASEVVGNLMEASLANLYYPSQERGFTKTTENWGTQMESAALNNIAKEFWPDIHHFLFRPK